MRGVTPSFCVCATCADRHARAFCAEIAHLTHSLTVRLLEYSGAIFQAAYLIGRVAAIAPFEYLPTDVFRCRVASLNTSLILPGSTAGC